MEILHAADPRLSQEVESLLRTDRLGHQLHYLSTTLSTNPVLAGLAREGAPEGTVVAAMEQTAGRGRMARGWFSPSGGGLYFSLLLRPEIDIAQVASFPLVLGLAVAELCDQNLYTPSARVKWPNDVFLSRRKCCGILCELHSDQAKGRYLVAGIGLNVNLREDQLPEEIKQRATSLYMERGKKLPLPRLLADLLLSIERKYRVWLKSGLEPFLADLSRRDALKGATITIDLPSGIVRGVASGLNLDGSLRLLSEDGSVRSIYSGDAHII